MYRDWVKKELAALPAQVGYLQDSPVIREEFEIGLWGTPCGEDRYEPAMYGYGHDEIVKLHQPIYDHPWGCLYFWVATTTVPLTYGEVKYGFVELSGDKRVVPTAEVHRDVRRWWIPCVGIWSRRKPGQESVRTMLHSLTGTWLELGQIGEIQFVAFEHADD